MMHPRPEGRGQAGASATSSFAFTLIAALSLALIAAVMIAPVAAMVAGAAGFRFPFPRIFDRTVMVTVFVALLVESRRLKLLDLLQQGFRNPKTGFWNALSGLVLAAAAMAVLFALAATSGADIHSGLIAASVLRYFPAAVLIATVEEAFFRVFLLAGIEGEIGSFSALLASSGVYAIVHVIRSPARFYLTDFEPLVGGKTLAAYADRMFRSDVGPPLLGLFLLGLVLGKAFVLTRRGYASLGLHAGFVLGAKTWRVTAGGAIPQWLAGPGTLPLIAAPPAWMLSVIILILLHFWPRRLEPFCGSSAAYQCGSDARPRRSNRSGAP